MKNYNLFKNRKSQFKWTKIKILLSKIINLSKEKHNSLKKIYKTVNCIH